MNEDPMIIYLQKQINYHKKKIIKFQEYKKIYTDFVKKKK
jgi:hypothetical protein